MISTADGAAKMAPPPRRDAMIGLILGLVLGIGLALGRGPRHAGPHGRGDRRLPQPPDPGAYPAPPKTFLKKDHLVMMAQPTGTQAEKYRVLRTNLDFATLEHEGPRRY